jgi:hypothetical protein
MLQSDFGVHNLHGSVSAASRWNAGVLRKVDLVLRACASSMYRNHFGTIPVEVTGESPQPTPTRPAATKGRGSRLRILAGPHRR